MSKQVKNILMVLAACCVISFICNIWQAVGSGKSEPVAAPADSTVVAQKDSVINKQAETIKQLKAEIDSLKKK